MRHGQMVYPFLFQAGFQIMRWPFDLGWNIKCPSSRPWLNGNESSRTMTRLCQVSILPIGGSRLDGCGGNFCDIMRCFDKFWWFRRCIIQHPVIAWDYFASAIPQHYFNLEQCVARCLSVFWPAWRKACCALTDVFLIYIIKPKAETYWSFYVFFRQCEMEWGLWQYGHPWFLAEPWMSWHQRHAMYIPNLERHTLPRRTRYVRRWSLATGPTLRRRFNRCWKLEDNILQWYRLWFGHRWWACASEKRGSPI